MTSCVTAGYFHMFCGLVLALCWPAHMLYDCGRFMLFDLYKYIFNMYVHTGHGMQEEPTPGCAHAAVCLCQPHLAICGEMSVGSTLRCGSATPSCLTVWVDGNMLWMDMFRRML
jgi:hypothetical protein